MFLPSLNRPFIDIRKRTSGAASPQLIFSGCVLLVNLPAFDLNPKLAMNSTTKTRSGSQRPRKNLKTLERRRTGTISPEYT